MITCQTEKFKIKQVQPKDPKTMEIGEWFYTEGWGYNIMTERGFVVNDTRPELQEEINLLERSN